MDKLEAVEQVTNFFLEWSAPELTDFEAGYHTAMFMETHLNTRKLDSRYGFTSIEALKSQLQEYCRQEFGWEDEREGA